MKRKINNPVIMSVTGNKCEKNTDLYLHILGIEKQSRMGYLLAIMMADR